VGKLGDTLKERRAALGLTLAQAEEATRIRGMLIRALEEGDYAKLPNPGYVRGYISSYARYLELDPLPLLAMYKAETGSGRYHELNLPQVDEAVAPRHQQHAVPGRAALIVVIVLALLSVAVWGITRIWRGPEPTLPEPTPLSEPTSTPESSDGAAPQNEAEQSQASAQSEPASELQPFTLEVKVSANGASWLEITVDDKKAYAGTLAGGQSEKYEVAESASVLVGRPSAVTVLRDGKEVKVPASDDTPLVKLEAQPAE
jgi:cytoskeletal protein RodZ